LEAGEMVPYGADELRGIKVDMQLERDIVPANKMNQIHYSSESQTHQKSNESGYTLVALIALMSIMMIFMASAAPSLQQQQQRMMEEEAIFRGEQVSRAIGLYVRARNGQLPTSFDQLLEGFPYGTKKIQILRKSAIYDPLSKPGTKWKLVRNTDKLFTDFLYDIAAYNGGKSPQLLEPNLFGRYNADIVITVDTKREYPPEDDEGTPNEGPNPFIGVTSNSNKDSIRTYYDITKHNRWIFTPLYRKIEPLF
jgi:type II secretory pathway pseudopilin PulG